MKTIKLTSAVAIDGKVHRAGKTVTVDAGLGGALIRRGKGEAAPAEETVAPEEAAATETDTGAAPKGKRATKKEGTTDAG